MIEVISCQFNETFMQPFFKKHYSFADKITIIDRLFPDGIDDDLKASWINEAYKTSAADWVLVVDADEFIFIGQDDLDRIGNQFNAARVKLFDVYRHVTEKELDANRPIKEQRRHGVLKEVYIKPLIIRGRQNIQLGVGNHSINGAVSMCSEQFIGAHWQNADLNNAIEVRINQRKNRLSKNNLDKKYGYQHFDITEELIRADHKYHENDPEVF